MCRNMSNNAISGPLPANWGFGDVFTQLQIITLENNRISGSLPASYGQGLKGLIVFNMGSNDFSGAQELPCSFLDMLYNKPEGSTREVSCHQLATSVGDTPSAWNVAIRRLCRELHVVGLNGVEMLYHIFETAQWCSRQPLLGAVLCGIAFRHHWEG